MLCADRVGIFAFENEDWMHYKGNGVTAADPYEAGHRIIIGWCPESVPAEADLA